jgi:hypothetical protein
MHTSGWRQAICLAVVVAGLASTHGAKADSTGLIAPAGTCAGADDAAAPASVQIRAMRCLIGWARSHAGLRMLRDSRLLDRSSLLRAASIRRCQNFSHTACGESFVSVFARVRYFRGRATVGENLAWGSGPGGSARATLAAWLASAPHRENLLTRGWRDEGLNLVRAASLFGAPQVTVWVLQFGRR